MLEPVFKISKFVIVLCFGLFVYNLNAKAPNNMNSKDEIYKVLSYENYYPPHERPKLLYHGVDDFQMNELDVLLILLGKRTNAVISNYELSYLSSIGVDLKDENSRFEALRSSELITKATTASYRLIKELVRTELIQYSIDYLYETFNDSGNILGGESYPPLDKSSSLLNTISPKPPIMDKEPNGLIYSNNYPRFYRINVYTSEHIEIAQLFGRFILEINDSNKRGLSLPRYAQYKHGIDALFNKKAIAYNGVTNTEEYVFPGHIKSNEVTKIHIQESFQEREYGNKISRTYTKQIIGDKSMVTLQNREGQFLMHFILKDEKIVYLKFNHPNKNKENGIDLSFITNLIDEYNSKI